MARSTEPEERPRAEREAERQEMLRVVEEQARATARWTGRDRFAPRTLAALARVPRHRFVPEVETERAYADAARPIGCGQTISQPYIVALMTDVAAPGPGDAVLDVGTGSGYQAAVLAELAGRVYGVERHPQLVEASRSRLASLGYTNVSVREGDGWEGWPEHAPYAAILVAAAASSVPPPLLEQLAPGGRLVIPVGVASSSQELVLFEKSADGGITRRSLLPVVFVPLVHEA